MRELTRDETIALVRKIMGMTEEEYHESEEMCDLMCGGIDEEETVGACKV